ncbi:MAG: hypothetical protein ACYDER_29295 [Ktedonobacteraceae bacterium]
MSDHVNKWELSNFVIDTYPETLTWWCDCGYASHDGGKTIAGCCGRAFEEARDAAKEAHED